MRQGKLAKLALPITVVAFPLNAAPALAESTGGAVLPDAPRVSGVSCVASAGLACGAGQTLVRGATARISGRGLDTTSRLVFLGRPGRRDDVAARPTHRTRSHVDAVVPVRARSGGLALLDRLGRKVRLRARVRIASPAPIDVAPGSSYFFGGRRKPALSFDAPSSASVRLQVVRELDGAVIADRAIDAVAGRNTASWDGRLGDAPAPPGTYALRLTGGGSMTAVSGQSQPFALYDHLFPIRGSHNLGYTNTNEFGGGRGHQGVDMFARCGTRLAAARGGRVQQAGYHPRAGNYVVIDGAATGIDYVYMHMRDAPLVRRGQRVFTGQALGEVGQTGNASGCHLHFELWEAPGWYEGGRPIDPVPALKAWDGYS